ncbi:unnamed protein product [Didymodactylos carnosus]|uniref:Uncharacterized protein n=1 Tax=Didymodactylos carnosus TaxID=1234261 RepID=A0A8S2ER04_9BILA|nr:unnamed protein product [Didymodactylos carnosus]CAF4091803.1 unnamed protein product [Didymodactylos carnosus]
MNTDPNEDNEYSTDNNNDLQHQEYSGRGDTEQNVDEETTSTLIKVITATTQDHSLLLQQQQPSIIDDNQSAASLPNTSLNVATPVHIQHLLDSIVDFSADYTKFKWIKLTALHLKDHALCLYNANKNKFHDWDVFYQMLIKQYTPTPMSTTTIRQTIEINDNNNLTISAQNYLLLTELTTGRRNNSSTNILNKELSFTDPLNKPSSLTKFSNSSSIIIQFLKFIFDYFSCLSLSDLSFITGMLLWRVY